MSRATNRSRLLAQRRAMLTTECTLQRITLVGQAHNLGQVAEWVKTGSHLVEHMKKLPGWASIGLVGLAIFVPKRAVSVAKNGLLLWQTWRALSSKSTR